MKQFIKNVLVDFHKECDTDAYGQIHQSNFTSELFGDNKEKVEKYCRINKGILQYSTYGWKYGTYQAFIIVDEEIQKACTDAKRKENPNYMRNMCSW